MRTSPLLEEMLRAVVCPACRSHLEWLDAAPGGLLCCGCRRMYPIEDGIPVLLVERAQLRVTE